MLPIVINVLQVILVLVSLLMILLVLMQRPKNEGLGAAFGGGATDQLFGAQTTNVLQTITRWLGGMFFALALLLSILHVKKGGGRSSLQDKLTAPTVIPAEPAPPLPPAAADGTSALPAPTDAPGTPGVPPPLEDGKPMLNLQQTPPPPGGAFSEPVKPGTPAPELEKTPAPAPGAAPAKTPDAAAPATPPAAPAAENKPANPAPAPEPPK